MTETNGLFEYIVKFLLAAVIASIFVMIISNLILDVVGILNVLGWDWRQLHLTLILSTIALCLLISMLYIIVKERLKLS